MEAVIPRRLKIAFNWSTNCCPVMAVLPFPSMAVTEALARFRGELLSSRREEPGAPQIGARTAQVEQANRLLSPLPDSDFLCVSSGAIQALFNGDKWRGGCTDPNDDSADSPLLRQ